MQPVKAISPTGGLVGRHSASGFTWMATTTAQGKNLFCIVPEDKPCFSPERHGCAKVLKKHLGIGPCV